MRDLTTVGVMFDTVNGDRFPTVAEVAETSWCNTYGIDTATIDHWSVVAWNPRILSYGDDDREAMDETNFDVIIGHLGTLDTVPRVRSGDWRGGTYVTEGIDAAHAAGFCLVDNRVLAFDPDREWQSTDDMHADMLDTLRALSDYPLLDDDAYGERDYDAWCDYAPTAWSDELRDLSTGRSDTHHSDPDRANVLACIDTGDALGVLAQHLHYNNGFSGDYAPNFLVIADDLERVADDLGACPRDAHKLASAHQWVSLVAAAEHAWSNA